MITFYNRLHTLHQGKMEMFRGQMVPCFEVPARLDHVLAQLEQRQLGPVQEPAKFDESVLVGVHAPLYIVSVNVNNKSHPQSPPAAQAVGMWVAGLLVR